MLYKLFRINHNKLPLYVSLFLGIAHIIIMRYLCSRKLKG